MSHTLSLRAARRLEQRINTIINTPFAAMAYIPLYGDMDAKHAIESARETTKVKINNTLALIEARGAIRRQIQKANEECNINSLIAQRKDIENTLAFINKVVRPFEFHETIYGDEAPTMVESVSTITETRSQLRKQEDSVRTKVSFTAVSEQTLNQLIQSKTTIQKQLDTVNDSLLGKNAEATITISDQFDSVLNKHDLI